MNIHRLSENIQKKIALAAQLATGSGTVAGTGVSAQGFRNALLEINAGTITGTNAAVTVKLQDSPDNSTWTDVTSASQAITSTGVYLINIDMQKRQQYLRAYATIAGSGTLSVPFSATFDLANAQYFPPAQDNTVVSV